MGLLFTPFNFNHLLPELTHTVINYENGILSSHLVL